jgi:hypothetical protein
VEGAGARRPLLVPGAGSVTDQWHDRDPLSIVVPLVLMNAQE